jgi:hypothetical protein
VAPEAAAESAASEGILSALGTGLSRALGVLGSVFLLSGDTPQRPPLNHYTTNAGRAGIMASGVIRPSSNGLVYLTPDVYGSGTAAQSSLALSQVPVGYFSIPGQNIPATSAPSPVTPDNNQLGGGTEVTTPGPVSIEGATWHPIC